MLKPPAMFKSSACVSWAACVLKWAAPHMFPVWHHEWMTENENKKTKKQSQHYKLFNLIQTMTGGAVHCKPYSLTERSQRSRLGMTSHCDLFTFHWGSWWQSKALCWFSILDGYSQGVTVYLLLTGQRRVSCHLPSCQWTWGKWSFFLPLLQFGYNYSIVRKTATLRVRGTVEERGMLSYV